MFSEQQFVGLVIVEIKLGMKREQECAKTLMQFPVCLGLHYVIAINLSCSRHADHLYSFLLWIFVLLPLQGEKLNEYALYRCRAVICQISFQWIPFKCIRRFVCCRSIITLCTRMFTYTISAQISLKAFTSLRVRGEIHFATDEMKCVTCDAILLLGVC
jgi:hypothetical protein